MKTSLKIKLKKNFNNKDIDTLNEIFQIGSTIQHFKVKQKRCAQWNKFLAPASGKRNSFLLVLGWN